MAIKKLPRLKPGRVLTSPVSGARYRMGQEIGSGGYSRVYHAWRIDRRGRRLSEVCLKLGSDQPSWHREAYFGELFAKSKRVIRVYDSFPVMPRIDGESTILFGLTLELARYGTVADYLERTQKPWSQRRAKREILALLAVLDQLHGGSAFHRDITPFNVFVCGQGNLKLGDFGIARHKLAGRPLMADVFNSSFVTQRVKGGASLRRWTAMDEVYQMGQLMGMLLLGSAEYILDAPQIGELPCDRELRDLIRRSTGPRRRRFADAGEMIRAIRTVA